MSTTLRPVAEGHIEHGGRPNKALHLTKRVGVPATRAIVEARLAGEARCWTDQRRVKCYT